MAMDRKDDKFDNTPSGLWGRRSNSTAWGSLSASRTDQDNLSAKRASNQSKVNTSSSVAPVSTSTITSPAGASSAFGLGSGAFASFGQAAKTSKAPGSPLDFGNTGDDAKDSSNGSSIKRPPAKKSQSSLRNTSSSIESALEHPKNSSEFPIRYVWILYHRPPTNKDVDYEKSILPRFRCHSVNAFWTIYSHCRRPSSFEPVSEYHIFKEGIRPVWEDDENKHGGKYTVRLPHHPLRTVDRRWENMLLALIGDQFVDDSEDICGAVVSVRSNEDIISVWIKNNGIRNQRIRDTIRSILQLHPETEIKWRGHDDNVGARNPGNSQRSSGLGNQDKRRGTTNLNREKKNEGGEKS